MNAAQERAAQATYELARRRNDAAIRAASTFGRNGIGGGRYLPGGGSIPVPCRRCPKWDECKGAIANRCEEEALEREEA